MNKDVIYIDADDEITAITDKVIASKLAVVALVLPKRSPSLQSSVNLKILNKTATRADKKLVLVTSDPSVMQIAGLTGMYVAKTLQSKPEIPALSATPAATPSIEQIEEPAPKIPAEHEVIELGSAPDQTKPNQKDNGLKKDKNLKVPNFDSFRKKVLIFGAILLALAALGYMAMVVLPKAKITITTNAQTSNFNSQITASPDLKADNIAHSQFALQTKTIEKTDNAKTQATGQRNDGTKATGQVTITNCESTDPVTVPAATTLTASGAGGYVFTINQAVVVPGSGFSGGGKVCDNKGTAIVGITAAQPGSQYNIGARSYSLGGLGNFLANGGVMGGGQDKITTIVSAQDCAKAKESLESGLNADQYKTKLLSDFEAGGVVASLDTFQSNTVSSTCSPEVGKDAAEVVAVSKTQYTMSGVNSKSLNELVTKDAQKQAGNNQNIADTGLSKATLTLSKTLNNGDMTFNLSTKVTTGLKQDSTAIAESVKGQNARKTTDTIMALSGVKEVKVSYSPFWVDKTPRNTKKISISYENGTK